MQKRGKSVLGPLPSIGNSRWCATRGTAVVPFLPFHFGVSLLKRIRKKGAPVINGFIGEPRQRLGVNEPMAHHGEGDA